MVSKKGGAAFTLIEMLIVISIIAILASLIAPAVQRSITTAKMINCSNTLKQWGVILNTYANDYNSNLPYSGKPVSAWLDSNYHEYLWSRQNAAHFLRMVRPYLDSRDLIYCPIEEGILNRSLWNWQNLDQADMRHYYGIGYTFLGSYGPPKAGKPRKITTTPVTGLMTDHMVWTPSKGWVWLHTGEDSSKTFCDINVLFIDGRVEQSVVWPGYSVITFGARKSADSSDTININ